MAEVDVIVVGSGAAGLSAACTAAALGASVTLVEATGQIGGTTAVSGGMMWIPGTTKAREAGFTDDSRERVETYLGQFFDTGDPRLAAFLDTGDRALRFLEAHTALETAPVARYPDYRSELPGATEGGRVLEALEYDGAQLGDDFRRLRAPLPELTLFGGMMISRPDMGVLRRADRSPKAAWHAAKLIGAYARDRLRWPRGRKLVLGNALAARLFASARSLGVEIVTEAPVERLVMDRARVVGVQIAGRAQPLRARRGVILATGGLSHAREIRRDYVPATDEGRSATVASGARSPGAALAAEIGARLSRPDRESGKALWVPVSIRTRADGSESVFPHTVSDRGKPGLIAVNARARRFTNEAMSYHDFVRAQLDPVHEAIPSWFICDARFLWRYGLGSVKPFALSTRGARRDGYLKRAGTIRDLATEIGLPPDALAGTVETFNAAAREGKDPEFDRGTTAYQRHMGDSDHGPNPCVAPITRAPFYAVAAYPSDLGMAAGIVTDAQARALRADGTPIPGLYAVGNDMDSVMQGTYPGPGITIGPALVFGFIAATEACGADNRATA